MNDRQKSIEAVLQSQLELLRLALYVSTQGPAEFVGERLFCSLPDAKLKTSQHIAMCAGQSVNTLLTCSNWRGIPVRDLYSIARSAVESFINAAFIIAEPEDVAERGIRWVSYRAWKDVNRTVGSARFTLQIASEPKTLTPPPEFAEFTAKGANKEWAIADTPTRLKRVGEAAGAAIRHLPRPTSRNWAECSFRQVGQRRSFKKQRNKAKV